MSKVENVIHLDEADRLVADLRLFLAREQRRAVRDMLLTSLQLDQQTYADGENSAYQSVLDWLDARTSK